MVTASTILELAGDDKEGFEFQCLHGMGDSLYDQIVSEEQIHEIESKLDIILPKEIRAVVKVHDGRQHIGYGLGYRLPTTDLLPIAQWKPYEIDNDQFPEELFECLNKENIVCANKNLCDDAQVHLNVYANAIKKYSKKTNNNHQFNLNEIFRTVPCELLIIVIDNIINILKRLIKKLKKFPLK